MNFFCKSCSDKKTEILTAVIAIIGSEGIAALTHRNVAKKAEVSLSATTYYFKSKEDMIQQAFEMLIEKHETKHEQIIADVFSSNPDIDMLIRQSLHENLISDEHERMQAIAIYELLIEAMRNPRYRDLAKRWHDVNVKLLSTVVKEEFLNYFSMFEIYSVFNGIAFHTLSGIPGIEDPIPYTKRYLKIFTEKSESSNTHA